MPDQRCEPLPILKTDQEPIFEKDCASDLAARKMYAETAPATVKVKPSLFSSGSGFFIEDGSRVVTNAHVVGGSKGLLTVETHDHKRYKARIEKLDDINDLAILRLEEGLKHEQILPLGDSQKLKPGDKLFAVGHPLGLNDTYISPGSFKESGRFDQLFQSRDPNDSDWKAVEEMLSVPNLAKDAALYRATQKLMVDLQTKPGNSGGPVVNSDGQAVGVVMYGSLHKDYKRFGWEVPVEEVKSLLRGPDKFEFDYKRVSFASQHPVAAAISSGIMITLASFPRAGGTFMAGISALDLHDLAKGNDATPLNTASDKIYRGLQWLGDLSMIGGAALSYVPRLKVAGHIGLALGVGSNIGQTFVPQWELVNIKRSDGLSGEPFLWRR